MGRKKQSKNNNLQLKINLRQGLRRTIDEAVRYSEQVLAMLKVGQDLMLTSSTWVHKFPEATAGLPVLDRIDALPEDQREAVCRRYITANDHLSMYISNMVLAHSRIVAAIRKASTLSKQLTNKSGSKVTLDDHLYTYADGIISELATIVDGLPKAISPIKVVHDENAPNICEVLGVSFMDSLSGVVNNIKDVSDAFDDVSAKIMEDLDGDVASELLEHDLGKEVPVLEQEAVEEVPSPEETKEEAEDVDTSAVTTEEQPESEAKEQTTEQTTEPVQETV